jgi:uncharacterized integral membrane protein
VRLIAWIIVAAVAIVAMTFAISNRAPITLDFWPLPFTQDVPTYLTVLGGALAGFLIGGFLGLLPVVKWKHLAKARARDLEYAEHRSQKYQLRIKELEEAAKKAEEAILPANAPSTIPALKAPDAA